MAFNLRKYQNEAHDAVFREWEKVRSTLLALSTASGKTVIAAFIAKTLLDNPEFRVLFYGDRLELVDQPLAKFHAACGILSGVERAGERASPRARCVIASLQTLVRRLPAGKPFTHLLCDEVHRHVKQHEKIHAAYPNAKILGLSGTPFRKNLADLSKWYETVAFERNVRDMIADGYVCPIEVLTMPLEIDVSKIGEKAGDYDPEDVATAMEPHYRAVARHIKTHAAKRTILAFLPLIRSSMEFRDILRDEGITCEHADGTMTKDQRGDILKRFEAGKFQVLTNSQLFSTGMDFIRCDCLINLALTCSRGEFRQRVGRITRILPGTIDPDGRELETAEERRAAIAASAKPNALLLDLLYQVPKHGLAGPACVFAESEEEEAELAKRIRLVRSPEDMEEISREIQEDREKKLRHALEARCLTTGLIDAKAFAYLLHDPRLIDYVPVSQADQQPVTDQQREFLGWAKIDPATVNSYGHARVLLDINYARKKAGLLPIFSVFRLSKNGVEGAEKMKDADADAAAGEPLFGIGKHAGTPLRLMPGWAKKWYKEKYFTESPWKAKEFHKEAVWCGFVKEEQCTL